MRNKILKIVLVIAVIVLIAYVLHAIKDIDKGTPNQGSKGNFLKPK